MKKFFKGFFKTILIVLLVVVVAAAGLIGYLTITEFKPADTEQVEIASKQSQTAFYGDSFSVLGWNIGYAALGEESDFFMDGGKQTRPDSVAIVDKNMTGICETISTANADFVLLQEVDAGSARSYNVQEVEALSSQAQGSFYTSYGESAFAKNYSCPFVPIPWPPLGKVESGLLTLSSYTLAEATRISLPCPFSWPLRIANLKRCLLVTRVPIASSERELVLVNLHLEAYDDGEGKIAQTKQLLDFLSEEYEKGNYVVAGGDWNQVFPDTLNAYPNEHPELWSPGVLSQSDLGEGWRFCWDASTPTCRLLNQPYDSDDTENTQYYVIDGFLISPNLELVQVQTVDAGFACSDHNPVRVELRFAE